MAGSVEVDFIHLEVTMASHDFPGWVLCSVHGQQVVVRPVPQQETRQWVLRAPLRCLSGMH